MRAVSLIEPLEDRIAPAATTVTIAPNGKSASYQDAAGDTFIVKTSKGTFASGMFTFDSITQGQLTELSLTGHTDFTGANIAFSVIPATGGAGTTVVNVGYIDAVNLDLGSVTVPGDLGRIDAGGGASPIALSKLTVNSLGALGTANQNGLASSSTTSNLFGTIGSINVAGNVDGYIFDQDYNSKPGTGNINQVTIGGSLDGGTSAGYGAIQFSGTLGSVVISGGIEGGGGTYNGAIVGDYSTLSKIGSVKVLGTVPDDPNPNLTPGAIGTSLSGGAGTLSGSITAATVGSVFIAGDIFGSSGNGSGSVQGGISLGTVVVNGSVIGGNFPVGSTTLANYAGSIFGGSIGSVTIGKNIIGGSGINAGGIYSPGNIQKIMVGGDIDGGSAGVAAFGGSSSASATNSVPGYSGGIHAQGSVGSIIVKGSLVGGTPGANVDANGTLAQTADTSGAIVVGSAGSIAVGKNLGGGGGPTSGAIEVSGNISVLKIGGTDAADGSVVGSSGFLSGSISVSGSLGSISVAHDIDGGSGQNTGILQVSGAINSLLVHGNLSGGTGNFSGNIFSAGALKSATIGGSIIGSSVDGATLVNTGYVQAGGIGTMVVGDALVSGTVSNKGLLDTSGSIRSTVSIGSLTIGAIEGNATNPAIISAVGLARLVGTATTDVAIGTLKVIGNSTLKVGANVSYADILAGYSTDTQNSTALLGTGVNADAQIGTIQINGNLLATNIVAGVGADTNGLFGTAGSSALSGKGVADLPSIISKISNIIVGGVSEGPDAAYGIAAQYVANATVGGVKVKLAPGADNDTFAKTAAHPLAGATGNTNEILYEV